MAKATLEKRIIKPAVAEVSEEIITLTLSKEEAQLLRDLTGSAWGNGSRRWIVNCIYGALSPYTKNGTGSMDFQPAVF